MKRNDIDLINEAYDQTQSNGVDQAFLQRAKKAIIQARDGGDYQPLEELWNATAEQNMPDIIRKIMNDALTIIYWKGPQSTMSIDLSDGSMYPNTILTRPDLVRMTNRLNKFFGEKLLEPPHKHQGFGPYKMSEM